MLQVFLQGLSLGLAYCAPIGIQNLFVINTALTQPKKRVFLTALIIIFFDVTLGMACFFGAGSVISTFPLLEMIVLAVGSATVIWIGAGLIRSRGTLDTNVKVDIPVIKVISTACVVTWFNPQALIDGTLMLGAVKATLPEGGDPFFAIGFACASVLWFSGVSLIILMFSAKFTDRALRIINIVCGAVIVFYGCKLFASFVKMLRL